MKAAKAPSRMRRASACQLATPRAKRRGEERIAVPWRRAPRSARTTLRPRVASTTTATATTAADSAGWRRTSETSSAGSSPVVVGIGMKPMARPHATSAVPKAVSNSVSGMNVAASVE